MESMQNGLPGSAVWRGNVLAPTGTLPQREAHQGAPLHLHVLATPRERSAIAGLRKFAAFGVEQDLGLELAALEQTRDDIGVVTAVYRGRRLLATLRFVPTGHGLTGAERLVAAQGVEQDFLGEGSWEVGRVIMAPEDRHPDLLLQCLSVTLQGIIELRHVRHFHATTTLAMARLWRRFGMRAVLTAPGRSGVRYALVHGRVEDVANALDVPCTAAPAAAYAGGHRVQPHPMRAPVC